MFVQVCAENNSSILITQSQEKYVNFNLYTLNWQFIKYT